MRRRLLTILSLSATVACSVFAFEDVRNYVVAVRRGGVIEFLDPTNLETVGRIHFNIPQSSAGLNGVFASPDGATVYIEGPSRNSDGALGGCCWLYSIDLATLETKVIAGVWGSRSRQSIIISDGILRVSSNTETDSRHDSTDHPPPTPSQTTQTSDRFVLALLRAACPQPVITGTTSAGNHLFVYQIFGSKIDPRQECGDGMPGGVWVVDPATGHVIERVMPDLHFWKLVSNRERSELYGLSYGAAGTLAPVELFRIDAENLNVLRQRVLDTDYWWIITASLRSVPSGDVWAFFPKP